LLLRRQAEGFSIRKRRDDGWEAKALAWYQTVLDDLTLIFGPDYSLLFDAELGRKPNIKLPTGAKNPKLLIVHACEMLENRMKQDLMEGHITPSPKLRKRLDSQRRRPRCRGALIAGGDDVP
jgi:hypothetical protein